jgi:hypothetical protein
MFGQFFEKYSSKPGTGSSSDPQAPLKIFRETKNSPFQNNYQNIMSNFSKGSPQANTIDYDRNDKGKYGYGIQNMKSDTYQTIDPYGAGAGATSQATERTGRKIVHPPGIVSLIS